MIEKIKKIINYLFTSLINNMIRILGLFIKKDYNLWIFGMDHGGGAKFAANSWCLYKYVIKNHPEIKPICITSSEFVTKKIQSINGNYCRPNSWGSFAAILKGGVYIFAYEMSTELVNFSKRNTYKVNVWHGMALKKVGYSSQILTKKQFISKIKKLINKILIGTVKLEENDFISCTSKNFIKPMTKTFGTKNIFITGQPRDDIFYKKRNKNKILDTYNLSDIKGKKIISYLPTHRDVRKTDQTYFIFDGNNDIKNFLKKENIAILQKNHYSTLTSRKINGNIYNLTDNIDTQDILYLSDILITDYSGCYFDFLHTQRPIVFYCYDYNEYITNDRELYFDYFDDVVTPGKKVYNEIELFDTLLEYLDNPALNAIEREKSLNFFHKYHDGTSTQKTFKKICDKMNNKYKINNFKLV